jgi:hypothetical protein
MGTRIMRKAPLQERGLGWVEIPGREREAERE